MGVGGSNARGGGGGTSAGRTRLLGRHHVFDRKLQPVALTANSWQLEDSLDGLPEGYIVVAYHSEDVAKFNPNALEYLLQFLSIKGAIFASGDRQDPRAELLELEIHVHVMQEDCKITTFPATFRLTNICRHGKLPTRLLARGDYVHNLLHTCSCEIVEDSFDLLSAKDRAS